MRIWYLFIARLRAILWRARVDDDLAEELQLHIEREVERHTASGVPADEARRRAVQTFGGVEQIKEQCRDARGVSFADTISRDARHGVRRLVRDWRFSAAAVVILALGIGANTAIFSVVNAALFRESRLVDPDRLVEIYQNGPDGAPGLASYPAFKDIAEHTQIFGGTTAVSVPGGVNYSERGVVRAAVVEYTTPTYMSVLGLRPFLGRWFAEAEDAPGTDIVAVVSHRAWASRFGADPSVVGRTVRIEGAPVTIVGVGPAGHNGSINIGVVVDFWLPISAVPLLWGPGALDRRPREAPFFVKARLRDEVTVAQAQAAMNILANRLAKEYPDEDPGRGISVRAAADVRVHPQMDLILAALASALLVVVGLVLAIACSNLATLLLVRGTARAKEVSVRLALGATRQQLVRHLLTESVLLSMCGGAAGCVMAWWAMRSMSAFEVPIAVDFTVDYRVLVFAVVLSVVTGIAFGVAPALKATRVDLLSTLRDEAGLHSVDRRWFTLKNSLVVFQVAVSVLLLSGTSVFLQMLFAARAQPVGYAVDGVAILETDARYAGYDATKANTAYEQLRDRIAAIPGVQSVTLTAEAPMQSTGMALVLDNAGTDAEAVPAASIWAGPEYFETLRISILFGRALDQRDRADVPRAAVINESMARRYFGDVNALGRRFRIDRDPNWIEVVGIARDTKTADLEGDLMEPTPYLFFRSSSQWGRPLSTVVARTSFDAAVLVGAMQRELRAIDVALPVLSAKTMAQHIEVVEPAIAATFLGTLGLLGLTLAAIGLYAVIAFAVSRRFREIGIRMALGARSQQVVWTVARETAALVGVGTTVGLVLSVLMMLAMRALPDSGVGLELYHPTIDPLAFVFITTIMIAVGIAAAYLPARRAAISDPLAALRHQ